MLAHSDQEGAAKCLLLALYLSAASGAGASLLQAEGARVLRALLQSSSLPLLRLCLQLEDNVPVDSKVPLAAPTQRKEESKGDGKSGLSVVGKSSGRDPVAASALRLLSACDPATWSAPAQSDVVAVGQRLSTLLGGGESGSASALASGQDAETLAAFRERAAGEVKSLEAAAVALSSLVSEAGKKDSASAAQQEVVSLCKQLVAAMARAVSSSAKPSAA